MDGYMDGADCLGSDMDAGVLHFNWSGFEPIQGILGTDHGLHCAQSSYMQLFWFFETLFWASYRLQINKTIEDGGIKTFGLSKSMLSIEIPFGSSKTWGSSNSFFIIYVHAFIALRELHSYTL